MTIDRYQGQLFAHCDECGDEFKDKKGHTARYSPSDFDILIADMKEAGWAYEKEINHQGISKPKPVYSHYCPDCTDA